MVPGVGLVHAPFSVRFPTSFFKQACELAPIFTELVDCVSLDGESLQAALSRTKQVHEFTARLLDIHDKMMLINNKEDIRLILHRSDYMLDSEINSLLQIENSRSYILPPTLQLSVVPSGLPMLESVWILSAVRLLMLMCQFSETGVIHSIQIYTKSKWLAMQ